MKNKRIQIIIGLLILISTSVLGQKHNIEANITGLGNDKIIIHYLPISKLYSEEEPKQDTIFSKNDIFYYDNPLQEPIIVMVCPKKSYFKMCDGSSYTPKQKYIELLVSPKENITIKGNLKDYYIDYSMLGSEFNKQYSLLRKKYIKETSEAVIVELQIDTLKSKNGDKEKMNELFNKRAKINQLARDEKFKFIKDNLGKDLSAYFLLNERLDTIGKYYNYLAMNVKQGIFKNALNNRYTEYLKYTKVREAELKTEEGSLAQDFKLKSVEGSEIALSSIKSKYIILDFWGTWCGWCIKGFPKLKEYYEKYKDKVEIVGIACNDKEDKWKKMVNEKELNWVQVFNNNDINKDVSVIYGVKSYPTKFILDKELRIVAKFVGETDEFYKKLDDLMKTE